MSVPTFEIRESYTVVKLSSLRSKMQALKQQTESVETLRQRIATGDDFQSTKYKQTSLNRLLQPKKISREKKAEILRIRKELEIAKFRTKLLEQERVRKMGELRTLNQLHMSILEENQDHGKYSLLNVIFIYDNFFIPFSFFLQNFQKSALHFLEIFWAAESKFGVEISDFRKFKMGQFFKLCVFCFGFWIWKI